VVSSASTGELPLCVCHGKYSDDFVVSRLRQHFCSRAALLSSLLCAVFRSKTGRWTVWAAWWLGLCWYLHHRQCFSTL